MHQQIRDYITENQDKPCNKQENYSIPRSKKILRLVLVLSGAWVLALVLLACGYSTVTSVPTNPAAIAKATATGAAGTAAQKLNQINAAEQRWKNKNINSYR